MNFFQKLFGLKGLPERLERKLLIVEGVEGFFHYHLRWDGEKTALCGESRVMQTSIPLDAWGYVSDHIREKYCAKCQQEGNLNES